MPSAGSGRLKNVGKRFFLQLAADSVRDVNAQFDSHGVSYARKAMILCGLSLVYNGTWSTEQLKPELRDIIARNKEEFEGKGP